ncbi:MAG: competence/damage-inducible protein A [Nitrospira sp.]|nr:competence/damage-inducible protein A [Nitrospira sp.]MDE0403750.1 competence/damage-inducible protein A [Nitrospira sp.]MDE0486389.1 competence/damage-inducible protein A [Nitrospira sp.]
MITAEIIAVGSELLLGGRVDTNSLFLSESLAEQGIEVRFKSVVGDDVEDIGAAVTNAVRRVELVLITGGLGPTVDDVTREAVARVTGKPLRLRPRALESITARLQSAGRPVSENQRRQAFLPTGAILLRNPSGIAPGFTVQWKRRRIVCLPGVSHEVHRIWQESLLPGLRRDGLLSSAIETRTIHTFGLLESEIDSRLREFIPSASAFHLGLLASPLGVSVSLTRSETTERRQAREKNSRQPTMSFDDLMNDVIIRLGQNVFSSDGQTMEEVVGQSLRARKFTIALAESCTGGLIAHRLTQVPGSSTYVDRTVVCYSNRAKIELLGVSESLLKKNGAVSAQVAKAMAQGIRTRSKVDVGLSVTGIAGPGGGTAHKPVGLVYVGLATSKESHTKAFQFHGEREAIKLRASQAALDVLRRWLRPRSPSGSGIGPDSGLKYL